MQGFNMGRYIPPDQEGHITANKLHNRHPLGARARHLATKGAIIVRFETPFAIWCTNCKPHETLIAQGVRFNAEKKRVGSYYSTPVWSFRFRHAECGGWVEVRTDPARTEYVVFEGGRRRDFGDGGGGGGGGEIVVRGAGREGEGDPFARVEGKVEDKRVVDEARGRILELQRKQERDWEDPYERSRRLRRAFRAERKVLERKEEEKEALKEKMGLGIEIVDEDEEDRVRAAMVDFEGVSGGLRGGTRIKPMFEEEESSSRERSSRGDGKGKSGGKRRRAADLIAERKALFRSELKGNTRAAVDPFLSRDGSVWQPEVRKRRTLEKGRAVEVKERELDTQSAPDESPGQNQGTPSALVDYGSDSD